MRTFSYCDLCLSCSVLRGQAPCSVNKAFHRGSECRLSPGDQLTWCSLESRQGQGQDNHILAAPPRSRLPLGWRATCLQWARERGLRTEPRAAVNTWSPQTPRVSADLFQKVTWEREEPGSSWVWRRPLLSGSWTPFLSLVTLGSGAGLTSSAPDRDLRWEPLGHIISIPCPSAWTHFCSLPERTEAQN